MLYVHRVINQRSTNKLDMNKRHWQESALSLTHGNIVQRTIFRKEGEKDSGAVLRYIDSFSRCSLEPGVNSLAHINEGIQEVFFVLSGSGKLSTSAGEQTIKEGDGILIPAGIEHTFTNDGATILELMLVVETLSNESAAGQNKPLIRNYRESALSIAHWCYLGHKIFDQEDGFDQISYVGVVIIDPLQNGDNHSHGPDYDEVWYMWRGQAIHLVGQEVCIQTEGTAISVSPCHPGHTLINVSAEPIYLFFFSGVNRNV